MTELFDIHRNSYLNILKYADYWHSDQCYIFKILKPDFYRTYLWNLQEFYGISGKSYKYPVNSCSIGENPIKSICISRNIGEGGGANYRGGPKMTHVLLTRFVCYGGYLSVVVL